jgi:hypothetical protein
MGIPVPVPVASTRVLDRNRNFTGSANRHWHSANGLSRYVPVPVPGTSTVVLASLGMAVAYSEFLPPVQIVPMPVP